MNSFVKRGADEENLTSDINSYRSKEQYSCHTFKDKYPMSTEAADAAVVASVKEYYGKVISPPGALRRAKAQSIPNIYIMIFLKLTKRIGVVSLKCSHHAPPHPCGNIVRLWPSQHRCCRLPRTWRRVHVQQQESLQHSSSTCWKRCLQKWLINIVRTTRTPEYSRVRTAKCSCARSSAHPAAPWCGVRHFLASFRTRSQHFVFRSPTGTNNSWSIFFSRFLLLLASPWKCRICCRQIISLDGCGTPLPGGIEGLSVLDLGSGSGIKPSLTKIMSSLQNVERQTQYETHLFHHTFSSHVFWFQCFQIHLFFFFSQR